MAHNVDMAEDEIERLLREVAGTTGGQPADSAGKQPAPAKRERGLSPTASLGGRVAFAGASAIALGVIGWGTGLVLPFVGAGSAGFGAAIGAFVTALVVGPPRWFSS